MSETYVPAWPTVALCSVASVVGAAAAIYLLLGSSVLAVATGVLATAVAAVVTALVWRHDRRSALVLRLAATLAPLLGFHQPRRAVRARRWSGWPIGVPKRIRLSYDPGMNDADLSWRQHILTASSRVLDARYTLDDQRGVRGWRCRMYLRISSNPKRHTTAAEKRADRLGGKMLGADASILSTELAEDSGDLVRVSFSKPADPQMASPARQAKIQAIWSTMMPGRWIAEFHLQEDRVEFRRRPKMPVSVPRPVVPIDEVNRFRIPLGIDEDGNEIVWDLNGTDPHALVIGPTGTGKTVLMRGIVLEAARRDFCIWGGDPKRIEFMGLRTWPNVQLIATTLIDQIAMICRAHSVMEDRYAMVEREEADESEFDPLIVFLDEYRIFANRVKAWWASIKLPGLGLPSVCPVLDHLDNLLSMGRTARVHVLVGVQRPDAELLDKGKRDNFGSRFTFGRLSPQGSTMAWNNPHIGVIVPRGIPGRGLGMDVSGEPSEAQGYWTADPRKTVDGVDRELIEALYPAEQRYEPMQLLPDVKWLERDKPNWWKAVEHAELISVVGAPAASTWEPPAKAAALLAGADVPADETTSAAEVEGDGYDEAEDAYADQINIGDLILVDEDLDMWATVTHTARDELDDGATCIEWRSDEDDDGILQLDDDQTAWIRHPLDEE